jgi:hypothetical protein
VVDTRKGRQPQGKEKQLPQDTRKVVKDEISTVFGADYTESGKILLHVNKIKAFEGGGAFQYEDWVGEEELEDRTLFGDFVRRVKVMAQMIATKNP